MSATATDRLMTTEELLSLPDDGMERWLINGVLHEKYPKVNNGQPMTVHGCLHAQTLANVGIELRRWLERQPEPRGEVLAGEVGVRLQRDPDTTVGIDVVYIGAELAKAPLDETSLVDGIPILAAEIVAASDIQEDIHDKIKTYLDADIPIVWIVDPYDRTVRVYRPGAQPQLFNADQELSAEPHMPGFRVAVARFFN
jgi:Uma2 family endonuclease